MEMKQIWSLSPEKEESKATYFPGSEPQKRCPPSFLPQTPSHTATQILDFQSVLFVFSFRLVLFAFLTLSLL